MVSHGCTFYALGTGGSNWIIDSGTTCHMCNIKETFVELHSVGQSMKVAVGNGHILEVLGKGIVLLIAVLADGSTSKCRLHDVLYIPGLLSQVY